MEALSSTAAGRLNERDRTYLSGAFSRLGVCDEIQALIAGSHREVEFDITLPLARGGLASFRGFRVQHDRTLGPFKGGLRFHPEVTRSHLRDLAAAMTWKTALMDLPMGGAKGGVNCDPRRLEVQDLREITRRFVDRMGSFIGPELDIPAPDMGTDEETMAWIYDAYGRRHGDRPDVVTGKPLALHGTHGRRAATGEGVALVTGLAAERSRLELDGARVAVHGFGNVARHTAQRLQAQGARVVAVSDRSAGLLDDSGLDLAELHEERHRARRQNEDASVADVARSGERVAASDVLALDVDVLVPAAIEHVITADNCGDVQAPLQAPLVVEGANLPISAAACRDLADRGITVVPDIMANAGGVVVSYLEWVQNRQGLRWPAADVRRSMEQRMSRAWERLCCVAEDVGCGYRQAAFIIAVDAIHTAIGYRGV